MNTPSLKDKPCFLNPTLYKMKALQKLKNNLLETLANYISEDITKAETLNALTTIQNSTCRVLTTNVNGDIIPGVTIPNNQCDC
jgi:succinyl-CoA synthetase alpha subunit